MKKLSELDYANLFNEIVGRPETETISDSFIKEHFRDSRILIVGAGGSIGSALAKRLLQADIENVYYLDRDESSLHNLALELSNTAASISKNHFIGDVRDIYSLEEVIWTVQPQIVIHAAALKHLVMLERFPREGYLTNLLGTLNVAKTCVQLGVEQFVNISTDKAANPSSVLGKTKKLAELLSEEIYIGLPVKQCSVRFGNVFASRGSVIETFIHQIENNIPVTITDPNVARYFMSRNEAANLILAAASLNESGTYIQNMGEEVKMLDVVKRIADYLGAKPKLRIIGLQDGEKMNEELYDGPTEATIFNDVSRSRHSIQMGLAKDVFDNTPLNSKEAKDLIEQLTLKYIKKA